MHKLLPNKRFKAMRPLRRRRSCPMRPEAPGAELKLGPTNSARRKPHPVRPSVDNKAMLACAVARLVLPSRPAFMHRLVVGLIATSALLARDRSSLSSFKSIYELAVNRRSATLGL